MKRALTLLPIGLSLGALALAGCGSDDESVSIDNAWARTSAAGQTTGAVYFELTVDQDDTLLGASVPASVAADAQVHEVVMADMADDDMDSGEMDSDERWTTPARWTDRTRWTIRRDGGFREHGLRRAWTTPARWVR